MNNQTVAFIAIVAVIALVFTAAMATQQADARSQQSNTQFCFNTNARCQNVNSHNSGHDITSITLGNQP